MEAVQQAKEATATDLGWLLDERDDAVVTLVAGETRLVAHRAVLTDRSPVFDAMFRHDTLEASSGSVDIPDVEGPVLRQLVGYLYCLQAPQLPGTAHKLLAAADKYGLSGLKEACERQVAAQLSVETAAAAAVLAIRHGCDGLRTAAIHFIRSHLVEVMASRGYADAVRTQPEDVVELGRLLYETKRQAPVDSGTSATAAPQPLGDRRGSQTPGADAPSTSAAHHGSPPDEGDYSYVWQLPANEKNRLLVEAAKRGPVGELEALLAAGADVATKDFFYGVSVLHWAAGKGQEEAARRLLAAGAALDDRDNRWQATPLHWAAARGQAAVARVLLAAGADHRARDRNGRTPLHYAALEGHTEASAVLLEAGADRAARDNTGNTPLDDARSRNLRQVEELLLRQGRRQAPVDSGTFATAAPQPLGDRRGSQTPAADAPCTSAAHHGSPPDEDDYSHVRQLSAEEKGERLMEVAKSGALGELDALLAAGADVADRDGDTGWTALHWAAEGGQEEAARRLLAAGAAVDARDSLQRTPLHWAAAEGHAAVVRLLLAAGADHGARNHCGSTPLHWAAHKGHTEAAAVLLAAGADTAARNSEGRTPLDDARRRNQWQVEQLLTGGAGLQQREPEWQPRRYPLLRY